MSTPVEDTPKKVIGNNYTKEEIVKIGFAQRHFVCAFGINLLTNIIGYNIIGSNADYSLKTIFLFISIITISILLLFAYKMAKALKEHSVVAVVTSVLILIPLVGIAVMCIYSSRATGILKQAGFSVGLLGVAKKKLLEFAKSENND